LKDSWAQLFVSNQSAHGFIYRIGGFVSGFIYYIIFHISTVVIKKTKKKQKFTHIFINMQLF